MIRCSERWSRVSINDLERAQLKLLRRELVSIRRRRNLSRGNAVKESGERHETDFFSDRAENRASTSPQDARSES